MSEEVRFGTDVVRLIVYLGVRLRSQSRGSKEKQPDQEQKGSFEGSHHSEVQMELLLSWVAEATAYHAPTSS